MRRCISWRNTISNQLKSLVAALLALLFGGDGHCYQEDESISSAVRHGARFAVLETLLTIMVVSAWTEMPCDYSDGMKMFGYTAGLGVFSLFSWVNYVCNA